MILYILLFISVDLFSQEGIHLEIPDLMRSIPGKSMMNPVLSKYEYPKAEFTISPLLRNRTTIHMPPFKTNDFSFLKEEFNLSGVIKQFDHGIIAGEGTQRNLPGIGRFNQAGLSFYSPLNKKLTLKLNLNTYKFYSPYFYDHSLGFSGMLSYPIQNNIRVNVFGSYRNSFSSGIPSYSYGFTTSIDFSRRFGTEIGVQHEYDAFLKQREVTPILIPYYKFDKATIGMDVGGLLKYAIEELVK